MSRRPLGRHDSIAKAVKFGKLVAMKHLVLTLPLIATVIGLGVVSCGSNAPTVIPQIKRATPTDVAVWLKNTTSISWLPRQVSGRYDGASALDNINQAAAGNRTSRHYAGLAFDIDLINGRKVGKSNPYWRTVLKRCRELGATETLGPGDKGHSTHIHAAWPR